jgi:serine protease Do
MSATLILILLRLSSPGPGTDGAAPAVAPAAQASFRVPYRLSATQHLLVRAKLNGRGPFNFVMDTGAPALFVSKEAAGKAGLAAGAEGRGTLERLEIEGGPALEGIPAYVDEPYQLRGMNAMGLAGTRLDGVMGYQVLAHFRIEIDLTRPTMTWTRLDSGSRPPATLRELSGGPVAPSPGLVALDLVVRLASALLRHPAEDPVLTRGFFGMELADGAGGPRVRSVLANGPAARAGVRVGDRITGLALPGAAPETVATVADLQLLLAKVAAGDEPRFTVARGRKTLEATVRAGQGGL